MAGAEVEFGTGGLVPVVVQDQASGEVLMLAYANREALDLTLESGRAHYFSRSRGRLWRKGDSSGNVQYVSRVAVDCDGDSLIYFVQQIGPACHTGERSCFFRSEEVAVETPPGPAGKASGPAGQDGSNLPAHTGDEQGVPSNDRLAEFGVPLAEGRDAELRLVLGRALALLERVVEERLRELPAGSYVAKLHERGIGYMAQKVVEEAGETIVAALERREDELIEESADLLFHLAVLLRESGQSLATVAALLEARHHGRSGETPPA